jgi:nucleoside 2-deoxyribosyltransferase
VCEDPDLFRENTMTKLFLSGPLFTVAERNFNAELARFLEGQGFEVWLPQQRAPRGRTAKAVFQNCVEGLEWADAIVACMDGPDPDSGTAWECGYAYAKGIPIVCYRTDYRGAGDVKRSPYNLMPSEAATVRFELPSRTTTPEFHQRVLAHIRKALRATRAKRQVAKQRSGVV